MHRDVACCSAYHMYRVSSLKGTSTMLTLLLSASSAAFLQPMLGA
jgi:hypothetical protein